MTDILLLNKQVFGTTIRRGGISRRAKRAMTEPLQVTTGIEMTYDDCESVDGGIAITALINAAGATGAVASIVCTLLLAFDDFSKDFNLSWGARLALKIIRFTGDVLSTVSFMTNAIKGSIANIFAKIVCGKSGLILDANIIAGMAKTCSLVSHFISFF